MGSAEIFSAFTPFKGSAPAGVFANWLGDMSPENVLGQPWKPNGLPGNPLPQIDEEIFEYVDVLESARQAGEVFTFLELGAGYGRWSARAAIAARQLGKRCRLGLAEANPRLIPLLRENMAANGVAVRDYQVFPVAAGHRLGTTPITVAFPDETAPAICYGHGETTNSLKDAVEAGFYYEDRPLWRLTNGWGIIFVPVLPLSAIINEYEHVDLADFDLQGAEADAIGEAIDVLTRKVSRLHIGTHGVEIEAKLRTILASANWTCVRDYSLHRENETEFGSITFCDGVQTWINPRFA